MNLKNTIQKLTTHFPFFTDTYDGDDDVYLMFGGFGSYISDVIYLYSIGNIKIISYYYHDISEYFNDTNKLNNEIEIIFKFIEDMYRCDNPIIRDLLNICIF